MKSGVKCVLGFLLFYGVAFAQVGLPPAQLVQELSSLNPARTAQGYCAQGLKFTLTTRGSARYRVSGNAGLSPQGPAALAKAAGAATGYGDEPTEPVAAFLKTRAAELAGQGEVLPGAISRLGVLR